MKNIVVLGAGTAGTLVSNLLAQHLDLEDWQITLIDRAKWHIYQPGLLYSVRDVWLRHGRGY